MICTREIGRLKLSVPFLGLQHGLGGNSTSSQAQAQAQAHMMQFNPLLYSYQLSMAHQLGKKKYFAPKSFVINVQFIVATAGKNLNVTEIQRLAEIQRQYLLEMMPQQQQQQSSNSSNSRQQQQHNWKT